MHTCVQTYTYIRSHVHAYMCMDIYIHSHVRICRVSFRKMVKGGQNNTYKINGGGGGGGAKGVHAIVRLLGGHDQISGAHLQD